jgi:hypothetical protein
MSPIPFWDILRVVVPGRDCWHPTAKVRATNECYSIWSPEGSKGPEDLVWDSKINLSKIQAFFKYCSVKGPPTLSWVC